MCSLLLRVLLHSESLSARVRDEQFILFQLDRALSSIINNISLHPPSLHFVLLPKAHGYSVFVIHGVMNERIRVYGIEMTTSSLSDTAGKT
jgi:hypothetical protein